MGAEPGPDSQPRLWPWMQGDRRGWVGKGGRLTAQGQSQTWLEVARRVDVDTVMAAQTSRSPGHGGSPSPAGRHAGSS